jgi:hypothetical protein
MTKSGATFRPEASHSADPITNTAYYVEYGEPSYRLQLRECTESSW